MSAPKDKTAIIYCRVSSNRQLEEGTSLDSQERACIAHAMQAGFSVGVVYKEAYTGVEFYNRPLLSRTRADIRSGKFQALFCYSTDRLSRDPVYLMLLSDECDRYGVELIFATESFENTDEGKLVRYVKGYASKLERERFKDRIIRGKQERYRQGKLHRAGNNLYGYVRDEEGTKRDIVPHEARVIKLIFEWTVEGVGTRTIARRLNESGYPPPSLNKKHYKDGRVAKWGKSQIARIIREPAYRGETVVMRWKSAGKGGKVINRPESEWLKLPAGISPRIVTDEVWHEAQHRLKERLSVAHTRNEKREFLLRGRIVCGVCGCSLYAENEHRKKRIYRCSSRSQNFKSCGGKRVSADFIEEKVWARVQEFLSNPDVVQEKREKLESEHAEEPLAQDLEAAKKRLAGIERSIKKLVQKLAVVDDEEIEEVFDQEIKRLKEERVQTAAVITEIESRLAKQQYAIANLTRLNDYCARVRAVVDDFSFEEKFFTLQTLGARVSANGKEWFLDLNIRFESDDEHLFGDCTDPEILQKNGDSDVGVLAQSAGCCVHPPSPPLWRACCATALALR